MLIKKHVFDQNVSRYKIKSTLYVVQVYFLVIISNVHTQTSTNKM